MSKPDFMEVVSDTVEDTSKNVKKTWGKLKKNKIFLFGVAGVSVAGLIVFLKNKNSASSDNSYITPTGYTGYPYIDSSTGSTGSSSVSSESLSISDVNSILDNAITGMETVFDSQADEFYSQMDVLTDRIISVEEVVTSQSKDVERSKIISQMQANSNYYNLTNDADTHAYLHEQNNLLASQLDGVHFDSGSGLWIDGATGQPLYTPTVQSVNNPVDTSLKAKTYNASVDYQALINTAISEGRSAEVLSELEALRKEKIVGEGLNEYVTYDATVDYQAKINEAVANGASDTDIQYLKMQREAKIKGENLNPDGSKKTSSSSVKSTEKVTYDKNVDYQAKINEARASGASQSVIDALTKQREAKIKGENLNQDGSKK